MKGKKQQKRLARRIKGYESMTQASPSQQSDIIKKHPYGFRKPGSNKK